MTGEASKITMCPPRNTAAEGEGQSADCQSADGSSADVSRKWALAVATGLGRSSCQASAKTLTMRLPCLVTLAEAMTSTGRAERRESTVMLTILGTASVSVSHKGWESAAIS